MAIEKLNMKDLNDGINSLKLWHDIHEEMLDKLELVKDKLEGNEGASIEKVLDTIEDFEDSIKKRSREIKKKHKEVLKYKNKLEDTGVKPTNSGAHIFISKGDALRRKVKNLLDDVVDNKRIRVDEANKSAISWWIEKEDKEDLEYYIDQRNFVLRNMESYLENKYVEIEVLINSAFNEAKKLENMEDADFNFSVAHYNVAKKMMEIKVKIVKATANIAVRIVKSIFEDGLVHGVLSIVGMWPGPVISAIGDGANALLYAAQGDWEAAALSTAFMIPGIKILKVGGKKTIEGLNVVKTSLFKYGDESIKGLKSVSFKGLEKVKPIIKGSMENIYDFATLGLYGRYNLFIKVSKNPTKLNILKILASPIFVVDSISGLVEGIPELKGDLEGNDYTEFTTDLIDMIFNPIPNFIQSLSHNIVEFPSLDDIMGGN